MSTPTSFRRACIIGHPVAHSLSPLLHKHWLEACGVSGEYTTQDVLPENLQGALHTLIDKGYAGCNLTLPHKTAAMDLMDSLDESAKMAGAVNTVVIRDGKMTGYNSDGFGFLENLKEQDTHWCGNHIIILGAGGAARAIIAALHHHLATCKITLLNRTQKHAQSLATTLDIPLDIQGWDDRNTVIKTATLLVNCTPCGMSGQPPLDIAPESLPENATVCDIVYRPLLTPLLRHAAKRNCKTVDGLGMLLHQGRLGFREWFGQDPLVTQDLYKKLERSAA